MESVPLPPPASDEHSTPSTSRLLGTSSPNTRDFTVNDAPADIVAAFVEFYTERVKKRHSGTQKRKRWERALDAHEVYSLSQGALCRLKRRLQHRSQAPLPAEWVAQLRVVPPNLHAQRKVALADALGLDWIASERRLRVWCTSIRQCIAVVLELHTGHITPEKWRCFLAREVDHLSLSPLVTANWVLDFVVFEAEGFEELLAQACVNPEFTYTAIDGAQFVAQLSTWLAAREHDPKRSLAQCAPPRPKQKRGRGGGRQTRKRVRRSLEPKARVEQKEAADGTNSAVSSPPLLSAFPFTSPSSTVPGLEHVWPADQEGMVAFLGVDAMMTSEQGVCYRRDEKENDEEDEDNSETKLRSASVQDDLVDLVPTDLIRHCKARPCSIARYFEVRAWNVRYLPLIGGGAQTAIVGRVQLVRELSLDEMLTFTGVLTTPLRKMHFVNGREVCACAKASGCARVLRGVHLTVCC